MRGRPGEGYTGAKLDGPLTVGRRGDAEGLAHVTLHTHYDRVLTMRLIARRACWWTRIEVKLVRMSVHNNHMPPNQRS
jgi:hypothetical protein